MEGDGTEVKNSIDGGRSYFKKLILYKLSGVEREV